MPNEITRHALLLNKAAFNQMRNTIYHLQRFMKQKNLDTPEIIERYLQMGKNIGATFALEFNPNNTNTRDLLVELYQLTLNTKVRVDQVNQTFQVIEDKCHLCKYHYNDIDVPGCYITVGMILALLDHFGYTVNKDYGHKNQKLLAIPSVFMNMI